MHRPRGANGHTKTDSKTPIAGDAGGQAPATARSDRQCAPTLPRRQRLGRSAARTTDGGVPQAAGPASRGSGIASSGQSALETVLLLLGIVTALVVVGMFARNAIAFRMKSGADTFGHGMLYNRSSP